MIHGKRGFSETKPGEFSQALKNGVRNFAVFSDKKEGRRINAGLSVSQSVTKCGTRAVRH